MNKFIFMVIISLAVGGLVYMNDPSRQNVKEPAPPPAASDDSSIPGRSLGPLDRAWVWLGGEAASSTPSATAGQANAPSNPPKTAEPARQSDESTRTKSTNLINTTDQDFDNDVINASGPVIVEFWKPGCPSCEATEPELVRLASELSGRVKVVKLNTLECRKTRSRFSIPGVPTLLLFDNGKVTKREVGGGTVQQMKAGLGLN